MTLSDLRDWVKKAVDELQLTQSVEYNIGRFLATSENKDSILIAIKQLPGTTKPPFLRYNRYKIHIISGQIFMSPSDQNGNEIDYDDDDPLNDLIGRSTTKNTIEPLLNDDGVWGEGEMIANAMEIASDGDRPCKAIGIKLLSSKAGPLYLDDGRIYYTLDLEIII